LSVFIRYGTDSLAHFLTTIESANSACRRFEKAGTGNGSLLRKAGTSILSFYNWVADWDRTKQLELNAVQIRFVDSFMKTRSIFACFIFAAVIGSVLLIATGASRESDREISVAEINDLKGSIAALRKQVGELEKRLQTIESKTNVWIVPPVTRNLPGNGLRPGNPVLRGDLLESSPGTGKIWGRGELNGWSYYLIPVDH